MGRNNVTTRDWNDVTFQCTQSIHLCYPDLRPSTQSFAGTQPFNKSKMLQAEIFWNKGLSRKIGILKELSWLEVLSEIVLLLLMHVFDWVQKKWSVFLIQFSLVDELGHDAWTGESASKVDLQSISIFLGSLLHMEAYVLVPTSYVFTDTHLPGPFQKL